jgi:hypothetical protein
MESISRQIARRSFVLPFALAIFLLSASWYDLMMCVWVGEREPSAINFLSLSFISLVVIFWDWRARLLSQCTKSLHFDERRMHVQALRDYLRVGIWKLVGGASKMLIIIFAQGSIAKANYRLGGTTVIFF